MEYDDNDFQSQNLHLAGEGSTNCPPALQSYALPKFDFDGHLRFDSLVETEVFLGIESSVANNWIEDFSHGSSGIEFSSSAVESCSISRRNNVWSEATSSESVEMLLKSVGQEEVIPVQTIFEESDACKKVGCIKQMDPNLKDDDNILTETGDVKDLHSTLLPDETARNLSGLEDVGDQPRHEDASQTQEAELPGDGNSSALDPNSLSDPVTKDSLNDEKGNDVNNVEFENLVDYHSDKKMHENASASETQVDNLINSVQSIITSSDELNSQNVSHHIMDICEENPGGHVASMDIQCGSDLDKPLCSAPEVEPIKEEIANEVIDVHEAAKVMLQGDSVLHTMGACSDRECPGDITETKKCEDMVVIKDSDVGDQSTMICANDTGCAVELRNNVGESSSSVDPILEGVSVLPAVKRCTEKECPEVIDGTNNSQDVNSSIDTDNGGGSSKSNKNDSGYGTENWDSNAEVLSGLDPTLKGDSDLHTVDVCSVKESLEAPADTNKGEHVVSSKDTDTDVDHSKLHAPDLSPMAYRSDSEYAAELGNSVSSCVIPTVKTDDDLHTVDTSSDRKCPDFPVETTESEEIMLSEGADPAGDQSNMDPRVASPSANISPGLSSGPDPRLEVNTGKSTEQDAFRSCEQPFDGVRKSEASVAVIEETEFSKGRSDKMQEVHCNLGSTCSSAEFPSGVHVTGASKSPQDAFGVPADKLNVESHVLPSSLGESTEGCPETEVYKDSISGKSDVDPSYSEKKTSELPIESDSMDLECIVSVIKGDGSSSLREDSAEKELIVPTINHDVDGDGSASVDDVPLVSCDLASCSSMDVTPLSSENGAATHMHSITVVPAALSPAMESHSDCKAESAFIVSTESVSGTVSPMVESGQGPVCEAEKGASCDTGGELLCIPLDQSLPISVDCNTENQSDPVTVVKYDDSKRSTTDTQLKRGDDTEAQDGATKEIKPTSDDNSAKTSANVTGDALGDSEGAMLSACLPEYRVISADPDHPVCGSHKGFETTEIPETKYEKGNIKDLTNRNASDTNVVGDGGKRSSNLSNPTKNDVSKDQGFHTSDITSFADLPIGLPAGSHPFPSLSAPKIVEGSQTNSATGQMDAKVSQEISRGGDGEIASSGLKGTTERKRRRASSKGTDKESAKKGTVKATTPMRQAEKGDKSSGVSLGKSGVFQFAQPSEIQYHGPVDGSSKNYSMLTSGTSSLPDLNSSAPASLVFQQPFTDLQQVQLRAQIFVYGALIQGTAPDEAYMVSAYGGHDGGRSIWENAWRLCIERLHSQKSTPINLGTPLQSSSGGRADQAVKQTAFQGKVISSPAGRASTKGIPPPASPMLPISSPLWSFPTPVCEASQYSVLPRGSVLDYQQAHTPLHPFQTSPLMNIVGQNSSWMSQSPFRGPWVPSQQSSAAETNIRFSAFPSTESVLLTPVKETNSSQVSGIMHAPSVVCGQTGGTTSVFAGVSPLPDSRKVGVASPGEPSSQPKSRKRKKISESKELGQISLQPQSQPESAITLAVTSSVSTSVDVTTPTFVSKTVPDKMVVSVSSDQLKTTDIGLEQRATLSKETVSKAKEARQQAEEASAHAAAAVGHSQEIWKQLDKQKNSRLTSDAEARLASAAVAVAAAAAVAKAAAAAANVASNAALQAVLMAREAYGNESESMIDWSTDGVDVSGLAASGSVLRAEDGTNNSTSIIFAAREAARRRVEAASAASKRAENMDAIVKAAELAAEAVAQAGTVVAMGDPLPLSELIKAGPEGYWKAPQVSSEIAKRSNEGMREDLNFSTVGEDLEEEPQIPATQKSPTAINKSAIPTAGNDFGKASEVFKDSSIMEGSQVEVLKEGGRFAAGWFTATVLSLQDGIACVCYTELQSDEGSGKLQEWVALDSKDNKPPKIRVARLLTPSLEGTRKRRREAMADYAWSVGDKVDAWIQNSWWEGVVTEKNKKDETILKVHFPAQGETSHVKAWHLRPSLIWKDGEWVEWSSMRIDGSSMEDGLPQEKRMKLGNPTVEGHEKDKTSKSNVLDPGKPEEPRLLNLSANEKVFNMGKNTRIENKLGARTNRTGLQKEGSVKFGIPKPKRKFMEVSKHYVANQTNKVNESNDSVKFAKYLMPQASGVRASKNTFKYDTKDKDAADNKLRGFRSEKQRSITDKTAPQKDSFSTDLVSASDGSSKMDHTRKIKDSVRQAEGLSGKRNIFEMGSSYSSDGRTQGGAMFSSRTPSEFSSSRKAATSATAKTERGNKGNFAPVVGKLGKIVEGKGTSSNSIKSTSEVVEPTRRSNRRIQPTSRLLEGLQSSLSISKIPSASHDKARSQNRNISRGSNHD